MESKIIGKDGAKMVLIPEGEFLMGSVEGKSVANERPQHKVILDDFYMDIYAVTVLQYRTYCDVTGKEMPSQPEWSSLKHPVVNITWDEAYAYAIYYGKQLPTEAQWEKACRAGTNTEYSFGEVLDESMGNFNTFEAVQVGSYKPNVYGLYDMHGNVGEWCSDWYGENYYRSSPEKNPQGPDSGKYRVLRGGGWFINYILDCRSAIRYRYSPDFRGYDFGFRCVARGGAK